MMITHSLNQKELESVVRLANYLDKQNSGWRYGQSTMNAIGILYPELAQELIGSPIDPWEHSKVTAEFYAAICPDPPREEVESPLYLEKQKEYQTAYEHYGQSEDE